VTNRRKAVVIGVPVLLVALAGWYDVGGHATPAGQPQLATLAPESFSLKAEFNRAADRVRLVVLLSPT
jgi:hypothetical protein